MGQTLRLPGGVDAVIQVRGSETASADVTRLKTLLAEPPNWPSRRCAAGATTSWTPTRWAMWPCGMTPREHLARRCGHRCDGPGVARRLSARRRQSRGPRDAVDDRGQLRPSSLTATHGQPGCTCHPSSHAEGSRAARATQELLVRPRRRPGTLGSARPAREPSNTQTSTTGQLKAWH